MTRALVAGVLLLAANAWASPPDVRFTAASKATNGEVLLEFSRGFSDTADRQKVVLHDTNGVGTLVVLQTMLLELADRRDAKEKAKLSNPAPGSTDVKPMIIEALLRAERHYRDLAYNEKDETKARALRGSAARLRTLLVGLQVSRAPYITYGDLDLLGKWLEDHIGQQRFTADYTFRGRTNTINDVTFVGTQSFLSGSFAMREPQFQLNLTAEAQSRPTFRPDLKRIAEGYRFPSGQSGPGSRGLVPSAPVADTHD